MQLIEQHGDDDHEGGPFDENDFGLCAKVYRAAGPGADPACALDRSPDRCAPFTPSPRVLGDGQWLEQCRRPRFSTVQNKFLCQSYFQKS
jgi:hypothetical protein